MIQQIIEKYFDSTRTNFGDVEIFVNPSRKDYLDMNINYGFRFIADMKEKKVYVWAGTGAIHSNVMDDKTVTPMNYSSFLRGTGRDKYFAGLQNTDGSIESDTYDALLYRIDTRREAAEAVKTMKTYDTKWLDKYGINGDGVKKYINKTTFKV